ncbi:MAG: flagellar basal body rod protein FlgB [Desulfobacteraceae bacterium]|nr:flagellar basal body rod protein FlgB [Desulfobacteraceae bacterium]
MDNQYLFDKTITLASNSLNLRARRHELILSNIANADTPGYKSFDLMVDQALKAKPGENHAPIAVARTHGAHLCAKSGPGLNYRNFVYETPGLDQLRGDGNTVDMERQMSSLTENQIMYKACAQILSKKFQGLVNAIKGGKQ